MKKFIEELKRRNVIKATLAYLVVAWVLLQFFAIILPIVDAPRWVLKILTLIISIGLPIWIIFSWVYEVTPDGLKKTKQVSEDQSISVKTNKRLNILILIGLVVAIIVALMRPTTVLSTSSPDNIQYSIAVLPFDNMSADKDNVWFCDGVTEDILTYLSKIKGLRVISRTSTERYRDSDKTIPEIAQELGVSYVVEGSVRKQGNKVLITAQLIDANDNHLWAEKYNENLDNIFKIQQNVSKLIVQNLKIKINPESEEDFDTPPTNNIEAYELYLKGKSIANLRGNENLESSIEFFQKAIDIDPNYADAIAEMAHIMRLHYFEYGSIKSKEEVYKKVNEFLDKALIIDPSNSRVYTTKGAMYMSEDKWGKAKEFFEKAIELNPNDVTAYHYYFLYLQRKPEPNFEKALEQIRIAYNLDPYSRVIIMNTIVSLLNNYKIKEAEELYNNKSSLLSEKQKEIYKFRVIMVRKMLLMLDKKDRTVAINFWNDRIKEDPQNADWHIQLSHDYMEIFNDNDNYLKHAKKGYELDTLGYADYYFRALLKIKKFEDADEILQNNILKQKLDTARLSPILFDNYYSKENYLKAQEILNEGFMPRHYFQLSTNLAQQKKLDEVFDILNRGVLRSWQKAIVFAILKEKDSMYYYIDREKDDHNIQRINRFNEMDPYRKEDRYKEYLRKNYMPITHWNEQ